MSEFRMTPVPAPDWVDLASASWLACCCIGLALQGLVTDTTTPALFTLMGVFIGMDVSRVLSLRRTVTVRITKGPPDAP